MSMRIAYAVRGLIAATALLAGGLTLASASAASAGDTLAIPAKKPGCVYPVASVDLDTIRAKPVTDHGGSQL